MKRVAIPCSLLQPVPAACLEPEQGDALSALLAGGGFRNPPRRIDAVVCSSGSGINGLAIVRSLGRAGARAVVLADGRSNLSVRSRFCQWADIRDPWDTVGLLRALLVLGGSGTRKPLLFIDNDRMLAMLAPFGPALARFYHPTCPLEPGNRVNDKSSQAAMAERAGLRVPNYWCPRSWADLETIGRSTAMPLIAKPLPHELADRVPSYKVIFGRDAAELGRRMREVMPGPEGSLIQEYVEGPDQALKWAIGYRNRAGECRMASGFKWRQTGSGTGGVGTVMAAFPDERVEDEARRLLDCLGYVGIFGIEFKKDSSTDELFFIELNARPEAFHAIGPAVGVDPPALAYQDLVLGKALPEPRDSGRRVFWISAGADIITLVKCPKRPGFGSTLRPYFSRKCWAVLAWDDLLPCGLACRKFSGQLGKRAMAKLRKVPI